MVDLKSSRRGWFRAVAGALSGLVVGLPCMGIAHGRRATGPKQVPQRDTFSHDPLRNVTTFVYDGCNRLVSIRDELTKKTFMWDTRGPLRG